MTLAYVQGLTALIVYLIATWAGLIIAMALLLPKQTARAEIAMAESPGRSLLVGIGMLIPLVICMIMLRITGPIAFLGFVGAVAVSSHIAVGASGLAMLMGRRIGEMSSARTNFAMLVRGAVAFSLGLGFPFIGWFLFLPMAFVMSLGAGTRAIWRSAQAVIPPSASKPEYDVVEQHGAF